MSSVATLTAPTRSTTKPPTITPPTTRLIHHTRLGAYWLLTGITATEMMAGAFWDLLQIDYVRAVFVHLGYPAYLLLILGAWKLPCAAVLMLPRLARLKEWAYAGAVFNYTGAAASHWFAGDGPDKWIGPLVFTAMALGSWALRPADRNLAQPPAAATRPRAWILSGVVLLAMLLFGYWTTGLALQP